MMLLEMLSVPGADEFTMHTIELELEAPVIAQLRMLLEFIVRVAVASVPMPWLRITSKVPEVKPLLSVSVLLVMLEAKVPAGALTV